MPSLSKRKLVTRILCILFALALVVVTISIKNQPFDEKIREPTKSADLVIDIKRMWRTVPQKAFPVSPVSAINAAGRVFETVELFGKTTNEVFALIGHNQKSNKSGYNFPFYPVEKDTLVYRFDCGNFGWQFNLRLDSSGRVTEVEKKWIH